MRLRSLLAVPISLAMFSHPAAGSAAVVQSLGVQPPHQRLLPLEGGQNFRDLGGYRTSDGRHVKWGLLYRSGSMHRLTSADYSYLESRGIRVICDFRDNRERAAEPVAWPVGRSPTVLSDDYTLDIGGMLPKGAPASWTGDEVRTAFTASYPRMLAAFNRQYRRMFAELLAGHAPLAFNCSAGKDRTGIAAALILTALNVPRKTVIEDYAATNHYLNTAKLMRRGGTPANMTPANADPNRPVSKMTGIQPAALQALMTADPRYIEAALAVVDRHPGGATGYLHDEFGLERDDITNLRRMYLE